MKKIENKNKAKILILIAVILLTSFATEASAAGPVFEIEVKKSLIKKEFASNFPAVEKRKSQAEIDKEQSIKMKKEVVKKDLRTDFTQIYKNAGARFGIDWQILAAIHSVETGQRGNTDITSYAGAKGPMQFIPATFRAYAIDGNGDGKALITNVEDAIFTAAHYLSKNLAVKGSIEGALYQYNHSWSYVSKVKSIASALY